MPTASRLVIYSTCAVTLIYLLNCYRKRRKRRAPISTKSVKVIEHPASSSQSDASVTKSYEESFAFQDLIDIEYTDPLNIHTAAFVKAQPRSYFGVQIKFTDERLVALKEQNLELENISFLESLLPVALTSSDPVPAFLTMAASQTVVSTLNSSSVSGSESDRALTPDSNCDFCGITLPPEGFSDPSNDIYEANPEELDGKILPRVLIPSDMWAQVVDRDIWHETFLIPAYMGGVLIGRLGKNVRELRNVWEAEFSLNTCPGKQDTLIFKLSCPLRHKNDVLRWVSHRFRMRPSKTTIGNPNQLKRQLPLGEPVPVQIRSLYGSKELFVTVPDEEYNNYLVMQAELETDYSTNNNYRMQLCEPVTSGTVAVVPHSQGFARALIISVYPTWPKVAFYYLLDHGTFGVVQLNKLRKIRAKYMRVPYQAIHVSWAHAFPVYSDIPDLHILRTFFNSGRVHAFAVRMETCCRASVAFGEPYSQPYSSHGFLDILVNACNSGLFIAVPLLIYPRRQSWLNGSSIPYYPFTYSYIDYQSLVTFAVEEDDQVTISHSSFHKRNQSEDSICPSKNQNGNQKKFNKSSDNYYRSQPCGQRRGLRGSATVSNTGNRRQNPYGPNRLQNGPLFATSQKENQFASVKENAIALKYTSSGNEQFGRSQLRKPLSNRNNSVSSSRTVSSNPGRATTFDNHE
ncbi:hypothetical protein Smp_097090.1 [Schistosoma mansoni]|nr:hypothetical protein Smp_097090.1 [Schistosoma mansoni]|eukprot:XP_018650800.1 hypothetical protein Smp_097090.1 [Schistosoma mansoni]